LLELLELLELFCCYWLELVHGCWSERELLNVASMEAGTVHDCHAGASRFLSMKKLHRGRKEKKRKTTLQDFCSCS
jgi:hypothetical protein